MKNIYLFTIFIFILAGCSSSKDVDLKWFSSKKSAIDSGIKEEGIEKKAILDEIQVEDEIFVFFYSSNTDSSVSLGVANLANKNNDYTWYRSNPFTVINKPKSENESIISWEIQSESGKTYIIYAGTAKKESILVDTIDGPLTPYFNKDLGIYYYIALKH